MVVHVAAFMPIGNINMNAARFMRTIYAACSDTPIQPDMIVMISKAHHSIASIMADGTPMDRN